jgi:hypothetical protein
MRSSDKPIIIVKSICIANHRAIPSHWLTYHQHLFKISEIAYFDSVEDAEIPSEYSSFNLYDVEVEIPL